MSKIDDVSNSVILRYMKSQNRPYSVQNVFDNLRGEIAKSKVSLALDVSLQYFNVFMLS